jgi:hypothetical protein
LIALVALCVPGATELIEKNPLIAILGQGLINIVLRFLTKTQVSVKRDSVVLPLIALVLMGCSSVPQLLDPNVFYIRSMDFSVDGTRYIGTAVIPKKTNYNLEIYSTDTMDLVTIRTCAREFYGEKVGTGGGILFWQKEKKFTYQYQPDTELEYGRLCPIEIASYDATSGGNLWAYIDVDSNSTDFRLPAQWRCNGEVRQFNGVSICQNRVDNLVKVEFPEEVIVKPQSYDSRCAWDDKTPFFRGKAFEFRMPRGTCFYTFMGTAPDRKKHRATVIGYSDIVIKEGD